MSTLEKQLDQAKKKAESANKKIETLKVKIEQQNKKKQPKSIMDKIDTILDIFRLAKLTKEEKDLVNYRGKSKRIKFASNLLIINLISEVLAGGRKFKMDGSERRHYPWFYVSSGFVFVDAICVSSFADTSSASRLSFFTEEEAVWAGKKFTKYYKAVIME